MAASRLVPQARDRDGAAGRLHDRPADGEAEAEALAAARTFGIKYPYFKAKSSSRQDAENHPDFPSVESFEELMS